MRIQRSLATGALLIGAASLAQAQEVHLNEIYASMTGTDFEEYIELIGTPGMSLDGYVVCMVEGEGGGQGVLDRVWDLTGNTMPANGFLVMGNAGSLITSQYDLASGPHSGGISDNVENGTETFYLLEVPNPGDIADLESTFYNGSIDTDLDLITLFDTSSSYTIIEAVSIVNDDWVMGLDNVYDCSPPIGPDGTFLPAGIFRVGDYPGEWCEDTYLIFGDPLDPFNTPGATNPTTCGSSVPSSTGCGGMMTLGTNYCGPAVPNTTGQSGVITATGSDSAAANDLTLTGTLLPLNQFAYFIGGQTQGLISMPGGSSGNLCIVGALARFNAQIGSTGATGEFTIAVDTTMIPVSPAVAIQAGETWNFQLWHRDFIAGMGATSNFTDAVSILFN